MAVSAYPQSARGPVASVLGGIILFVTCLFTTQAGATVLTVSSGGLLTGATGVNINGSLYSVVFQGGTCTTVFGTCQQSNFTFNNLTDATAAGQALLNQVFVDGPAGNFDSTTNIIQGCTDTTNCVTRIPYAIVSGGYNDASAFNWSAASGTADSVVAEGPFAADNGPWSNVNYAVFTKAVPEPPTVLLTILGLAVLLRVRWTARVTKGHLGHAVQAS